jgi:hypothetical protein
MKSPLSCSDED